MKAFHKFNEAIEFAKQALILKSYPVLTEKWQGKDLKDDPNYTMRETMNVSFSVNGDWPESELAEQIRPNLPWADKHFLERIGGLPLNPGDTYKEWPFYNKKDEQAKEFQENGQFSHSYMERFWPKLAGVANDFQYKNDLKGVIEQQYGANRLGIRYNYGDLQDIFNLLLNEPFTRQAFLPIWFPEDTGAVHGGRVPCTIGYHFMRRENNLHMVYYIRSCDYFRHFRDDIYLAMKLLNELIERLKRDPKGNWDNVKPGWYTMHITSLHIWEQEYLPLKNGRLS